MTLKIDIDDDAVNSIEYLERAILAQDICGQVARKYLDSLRDDMAQQAKMRKGSKKAHIRTPHFEFDFRAKRTLNEAGKNVHSALFTQPK